MKILSLLIKKKCYSLASRRGSRFDIYCSVFFDLRKETLKMRLVTIKKGVKLLMTKKVRFSHQQEDFTILFFSSFLVHHNSNKTKRRVCASDVRT